MLIRRRRQSLLYSLAICVLAFGASIAGAGPANAYAYTGCRWPNGYISWSNYTTAYDSTWNSAFSNWDGSSDVTFSKVGTNSYAGAIVGNATNFGSVGWDGMAPNAYSCSGGYWSSTGNPVQLNTYYTDGYTGYKRWSVAAHEIGHMLGLAHVGSGTTACSSVTIMNPYTSHRYDDCGKYTPWPDDISGVNALY